MEVIFLFVGIIFIGVAGAICLSDVTDRRGTDPVPGRVIGFSTGRSNNPNSHFQSVAQYQGSDGRNYYIEGSIGSSVPLQSVEESVTVLLDSLRPERAVLQSRLPFAFDLSAKRSEPCRPGCAQNPQDVHRPRVPLGYLRRYCPYRL